MAGWMQCFLRHRLHWTAFADGLTIAFPLQVAIGTTRVGGRPSTFARGCCCASSDTIWGCWGCWGCCCRCGWPVPGGSGELDGPSAPPPLVPGSKLTFFWGGF
uniref:Putative secreted peptide n=1 Tax=Anopheles braziliensis TaxID=58242 RepID=A0A2M3ZTR3_9DIPT